MCMIGAIILSGGKSTRITYDKAFINLRGKSLLSHVTKRIVEVVDEVVIAVRKDGEDARYLSILPQQVRIAKDMVASKGPLVGIISGMKVLKSEYAVVLPCDSPFINIKALKYLFNKAQGSDAAVPRWPNGYIEPLHAVYKVSSAVHAGEETLKIGEFSVIAMIKRLGNVVYIPIREVRKFDRQLLMFFNINTPEDLNTAQNIMRSQLSSIL